MIELYGGSVKPVAGERYGQCSGFGPTAVYV